MGRSWTEAEDRLLRKLTKAGTTIKVIQREYLPTRTVQGINMRRHTLGIGQRKRGVHRTVLGVSVATPVADIVKECAAAHHLTTSEFVARIITEYLDQ